MNSGDESMAKNSYYEDINKLLNIVMKNLKKKMFPYKHRKLLDRKVTIIVKNIDKNLLGTYQTLFEENKLYKFTHEIVINEFVYDEFKRGYRPDKLGEGKYKMYCRKRIKNVIAHELIHAYVYENYELYCNEYHNFHGDSSPIFLSILTFLNIPSGHPAMKSFRHAEIYKEIIKYNNFKALELYLIRLFNKYENTFEQLKEILIGENEVTLNSFTFSNGNSAGLKGVSTYTAINENCIGKCNYFEIGANAEVTGLKESVIKKINGNVFKEKTINKEDIRMMLKMQSMNI